jgi:hypothetical protein
MASSRSSPPRPSASVLVSSQLLSPAQSWFHHSSYPPPRAVRGPAHGPGRHRRRRRQPDQERLGGAAGGRGAAAQQRRRAGRARCAQRAWGVTRRGVLGWKTGVVQVCAWGLITRPWAYGTKRSHRRACACGCQLSCGLTGRCRGSCVYARVRVRVHVCQAWRRPRRLWWGWTRRPRAAALRHTAEPWPAPHR